MAVLLLLVLIAFPFAEIALLIAVGREIGVLATLALLGLAFLGGVLLIRVGGVATLFRLRGALARGEPPAEALFHAACFVAAGFLLMIPGFLTDAMALALLLLLPFRNLVKTWLWRRARHAGPGPGGPGQGRPGQGRPGQGRPGRGPVVIEGEYETVEDAAPGGQSPWRRDNGSGRTLDAPPSRD